MIKEHPFGGLLELISLLIYFLSNIFLEYVVLWAKYCAEYWKEIKMNRIVSILKLFQR